MGKPLIQCHCGHYRYRHSKADAALCHCGHCGIPWDLGPPNPSLRYETVLVSRGLCWLCEQALCDSCLAPGKPGRPPEDWIANLAEETEIPWDRIVPCQMIRG
jgi:hypothetical protein